MIGEALRRDPPAVVADERHRQDPAPPRLGESLDHVHGIAAGGEREQRIGGARGERTALAGADEDAARALTDGEVLEGNVGPGKCAAGVWKELLGPGAHYDFSADEVIVLNPEALDYPGNARDVTERWRLALKADLLGVKVNPEGKSYDEAEACRVLLRRLDRFAARVARVKPNAVLEAFLSSVGRRYDSGTNYISPSSYKEFEVQVSGVLVGIGATLKDDNDGHWG